MGLDRDLVDWTDWDFAAYQLGRALGVFSDEQGYQLAKGIFWTDNPLGDSLHLILLELTEAGVLERRDEPDEQFRWTNARGASTGQTRDWRPEGWDSWPHDRRRIWRLEQQLLRYERRALEQQRTIERLARSAD